MKYNNLESDYRFCKISKEKTIEILKELDNKWVYIKIIQNFNSNENLVSYNKLKVKKVLEIGERIEITGIEERDRLDINLNSLVQTEFSNMDNEIKLIFLKDNLSTNIFLKEYFPRSKERIENSILSPNTNLIITEGKTDWKHLKSALKKFRKDRLYLDLDFEFLEYEKSLGDGNEFLEDKNLQGNTELEKICDYNTLFFNEKLRIFVFDSDNKDINKKYKMNSDGFCYLGNNIYAIILPIPEFRKNTPLISIENYYTDKEIKTKDNDGKRLYMGHEFSYENEKQELYYLNSDKLEPNYIIDSSSKKSNRKGGEKYSYVYKKLSDRKVMNNEDLRKLIENDSDELERVKVLSKNEFSENILNNVKPFDNFSKENFKLFFNVIVKIFQDEEKRTEKEKKEKLGLISENEIEKGIIEKKYNPELKKKILNKEIIDPSILHNGYSELYIDLNLDSEEIKRFKENKKIPIFLLKGNDISIKIIDTEIEKDKEIKISTDNKYLKYLISDRNNRVYLKLYDEENIFQCEVQTNGIEQIR